MRNHPIHRLAVALGAALSGAALLSPAPVRADEAPAAPAPNYKIQYNGLIDGYYQFQFNDPKFKGVPNNLGGGRVYDVRHNAPTIALAELNVFENAKPGGFGFKSTLIAGDVADINHANFPSGGAQDGKNESRFKNIQQLYGTYSFKGGAGIDLGKFYTPFGYEVTESNANYNYSRSLPYNLLPFYNAGVRAYTPSMKGLVATGYITRAIFNTATAGLQDDNKKLAFIGQLSYAPTSKYTAITTWGFGKDKLGGTETNVLLGDTDFTYNLNPKMLLGANYVYSRLKPTGMSHTTNNGYALYIKDAVTAKTAYALRFSGFQSKTPTTGGEGMPTTSTFRPWEVTATYEVKPAPNFLTRVEFRHDKSNIDAFLDKNAAPTKKNQDTLTLSGVFTF